MACQSGRSASALASLFAIAAAAPAAAGPTGWAHQAAGFQSNGAVSIKSLAGGSYTGTQNPAGAVAKANQSAVTQPPTVIIQATASSGGFAFASTLAMIRGDMGGSAGGTAMCVAEFGAGWRMATIGRLRMALGNNSLPYNGEWIESYGLGNCGNWTSTSAAGNGTVVTSTSASANYYTPQYGVQACNIPAPVLCSNF